MASTTINHRRLFNQTITILNANFLHFITISLLFLPPTIFITAIQPYITNDFQNLLTVKTLGALLLVSLSAITGTALTTYSTIQATRNKPLTFTTTIKSLSGSFISLLYTFIAALMKLAFISFLIKLLFGYYFSQFTTSCVLVVTCLFYKGLWGSVPTIVVLESRSGLKPRMLSYWILFYTVGIIGIFLKYNAFLMNKEDVSKWFSVVQVGMNYVCSLLMIVQYVAANTVLFLQCQEARNEQAHEDDVRVLLHGGFSYMLYVFILVLSISLLMSLE